MLREDTREVVFGGEGSTVASGAVSSVAVDRDLEPGVGYVMYAVAVDENGDVSAPVDPVGFELPRAWLESPRSSDYGFGTETISAFVDDSIGATGVAFLVDEVVIETDTNGADGWSAEWDTTTEDESSSHTVQAIVTDSVNQTYPTAVADVTVANTADAFDRIRVDRAAGRLDLDAWALSLGQAIVSSDDLPARYASAPTGTESLEERSVSAELSAVLAAYPTLSPGTQAAIDDLALALPAGLGGTSEPKPGCLGATTWGEAEFRGQLRVMCETVFAAHDSIPELRFWYTVGADADTDVPATDTNTNNIPDRIEDYRAVLDASYDTYDEAGYPIPDDTVTVAIYDHGPPNASGSFIGGLGDAVYPDGLGQSISLDPRSRLQTVAHEAFHTIQAAFTAGNPFELLDQGPSGRTLTWEFVLESTAEWAPTYYAALEGSALHDLPGHQSVGDGLMVNPNFWEQPRDHLVNGYPPGTQFVTGPGEPPLTREKEEYSGAVFWQYLSDRYSQPTLGGDDVVLDFFQALEANGSQPTSLHKLLAGEITDPLGEVIRDFWAAAHLLEDRNDPLPDLNWDQPSSTVGPWRQLLAQGYGDGNGGHVPIAAIEADAFGVERLNHTHLPIAAEDTDSFTFLNLRPGGGAALDVVPQAGHTGDLEIVVTKSDPDVPVGVTAVGFDATGHPHVCVRNPGGGQTVEIDQWMEVAPSGTHTLTIDSTCRTVSVIVAHTDLYPLAPAVDVEVEVSFTGTSAQSWPPAVPIGGPAVTGLAPGVLGQILSFPAAQGPATGELCVDVEVFTGAG